MEASVAEINAMSAIMAETPGHAGEPLSDMDAALMDILISRLPSRFEKNVREDRMMAFIVGRDIAIVLSIVRYAGRVLFYQKIAASEAVVVPYATMEAALTDFERTFKAEMPKAIAMLRGDALLH